MTAKPSEVQRLRDRMGGIMWRVQEDVAVLNTHLKEVHKCGVQLAALGEPVRSAPYSLEITSRATKP